MAEAGVAVAETSVAFRPRLLIEGQQGREALADYRRRGGYASASWSRPPEELRSLVDASGLRGRGGSAFPTGRKWQSVAAEPGPRVLLVNGAETEPASSKDRYLLTQRPHLVLEGALLAARAVDAATCIFYLRANGSDEQASLKAAWQELQAARCPLPRLAYRGRAGRLRCRRGDGGDPALQR